MLPEPPLRLNCNSPELIKRFSRTGRSSLRSLSMSPPVAKTVFLVFFVFDAPDMARV